MNRRSSATRRLVLLATGAALTLTACATSTTSAPATSGATTSQPTPTAVPTMTLAPTGAPRTVSFSAVLSSAASDLHSVGPGGQARYGWNNLVGSTEFDGQAAKAQLQGSLWYVNGTGPFDGFLTLTWPDGSALGMAMTGTAQASGSDTAFVSGLVVIGGTGRYVNASGSGQWSGSRSGALGSAVRFDGTLTLRS